MKELKVAAKVENIELVTDFVNELLESADCPMKAQMQIDIAIDELFSNIALYAYASGEGKVTVRAEVQSGLVSISFIDEGIPYDPLSAKTPDTSLPAEEREIGGLGIHIVKKTMDDLRYEYKDGRNILTVVKKI